MMKRLQSSPRHKVTRKHHSGSTDSTADHHAKDTDSLHSDSDRSTSESFEKRTESEFERNSIRCIRYFIGFLMIGVTASGVFLSYKYLKDQQDTNFTMEFNVIANDIQHLSSDRVTELLGDTQSLAHSITTMAINSGVDWPYFTDPNFGFVVSSFMTLTDTHVLSLAPIIHDAVENANWTKYAQANKDWIQRGLEFEKREPVENATFFPSTYRMSAGVKIPERGQGPFLPVWQTAYTPDDGGVVNFNLLSDEHYSTVFDSVLEGKKAAMTDTSHHIIPIYSSNVDFDELHDFRHDMHHEETPNSLLLYPVFKDSTEDEIVAILNADFDWVTAFALSTDEEMPAVDVVVDDMCGQTFTIQVKGNDAHFVGFGDHRDPNYGHFCHKFEFAPSLDMHHTGGDECSYMIHIHATKEFSEKYHTSLPKMAAILIAAIFLFMILILYLYDAAVNARQKRILKVASKSEKLLSVLYPKTIRDRLFHVNYNSDDDSTAGEGGKQSDLLKKATKYQLKTFMATALPTGKANSLEFFDSKPIADLFLHATVLFADISGFTAWSSVREPSQVFTLLETVYRAFDVIAKRRKVFKVETVGDCYVAVTGLPEPRKDHACIMAGFARECVDRFGELVGVLETTLGPDTGDLGIRVGIHSGPVTAGVLRGDKSRFQLFGDTVNTASRIEATGRRNRIHISEETADLLALAGKADWLRRRDQLVTAKGKGNLQTFWLMTKQDCKLHELGYTTAEFQQPEQQSLEMSLPEEITQASLNLSTSSYEDIEALLSPKMKRLCQWNVDVLARLLKQIVAHRLASQSNHHKTLYDKELTMREGEIRCQFMVLDELVETIPLPGFDQKVYKRQQNPDDIVLPEAVMEQMKLYVACVAAMYRDNPFHNFEHASHVMMSVSKLLSRIIAADEILNANENAAKSHDFGWSLHDHTYGITSDPMTQFSVILAALVHDLDHLGVSNFQLIKEDHKLAHIFKNKSVAEQNSIVLAWDTLMHPRFCEFRRTIYATPFELERFRQLMANTVLATDIFDKQLQTLRRNRWEMSFSGPKPITRDETKDNVNRKATIVIEHLIQASDVAHTMQHWHIYRKWNERLFHEMTVAYKAGRMENNPAEMWYKGELGFFDNYIIPLAKKLKECGVFGVASDEYLNYAMENRREWEEKGEAFVKELVQKYHTEEREDTNKLVQSHRRNPKRMSLDFSKPQFNLR
ncbi:unnamed protein product [Cylindrotheca closterium]|uniref:Guanylate cyclase domain-containing protein n=1 Tax=Cylindrotheca closterium TaxID=2856 RepID=A0AAD2G982_9STRA|nr:unnamed protein product [Cylindrotheca closterium]